MNVVITGVSRGIGKAMAIECLERGYSCVGVTRDIAHLSKQLLEHPRFQPIEIDWMDFQSYSKVLGKISNGIDILINNAATILVKSVSETSAEDLRSILDVNLIAPFQFIRAMHAGSCFANGAHIVNISSMGGFQGAAKFPELAAYSISKASVVAMTESMAIEYPGLSVNCLCLGAVQTEMLKQAFPSYEAEINDVQMAKYILDFSVSSANLMTGCIIPVKKVDPN